MSSKLLLAQRGRGGPPPGQTAGETESHDSGLCHASQRLPNDAAASSGRQSMEPGLQA